MTSCRKRGLVNTWGRVHRVADCQPTQLDAVGEELAVIPIDLNRGDTKEGRKEVRAYRFLQWREEWGSVGDYSLDVLPFVLHAEGEASVRRLRIPLSNSAEGYHGSSPLLHHPSQPLLLLLSAPNEAAEVALPSRVVDVEAEAFKGLAGSVLVLGLANVVRFARLREVPILRPKLHKEVKASSIGQRLASRACVVAVPWLQGLGDCLAHLGRKWHQRHTVQTHGEAVALRDPLPRLDDNGRVTWRRPHHAPNPVPVSVKRKPAPPIPQVGHVPQHEVAVELVEAISGIEQSRAEPRPLLVAGVAVVLRRPWVDPRAKHPFRTNPLAQGQNPLIPIVPFLTRVLCPSRRLRPDCADGVEIGFNARPKASAELGVATRVGGFDLRLGVAAVRPQPHPNLTDPQGPNPRGLVQGNSAHRVHRTVRRVGGRAIAQPIHPCRHHLPKTLRLDSVAEEPGLEHDRLDAAGPHTTGEAYCGLGNTLLEAVDRHRVEAVRGARVNVEVFLRRYTGSRMLLPKHIDDGTPRLRVQIIRAVGAPTVPFRDHAHCSTDLPTKDHVVVLPGKRGRVGPPHTRATTPTTDIEVGLLDRLH